MKKAIAILSILAIAFTIGALTKAPQSLIPYAGSSFNDVWNQVISDPYRVLPQYKISAESLKDGAMEFAATGTLDDRNDFRQTRQKLVHPNGVCMAGYWSIDANSTYSGYFKFGKRALIIARASATQDETRRNQFRAFGLAVKLFPTTSVGDEVYTSNVFTVDNIQGAKVNHFTDVAMTNHIPNLRLTALYRLIDKLEFLLTFNGKSQEADFGADPLFRRTVEIARAGETLEFSRVIDADRLPSYKVTPSIEPKWIKFQAVRGQISHRDDFRNEVVDIIRTNGRLVYAVSVASRKDSRGVQNWQRIGIMEFTQAVASETCDKRLHFHHPRQAD